MSNEVCPRCGVTGQILLALSRTDNVTKLCHMCGTNEALEVAFDILKPQTVWAFPVLPYNGSSGFSGSDSSRARAVSEDASGITGDRQRQTMDFLQSRLSLGATWRDLAEALGWHHGQASGALSVLHRAGHITRLKQTRDRCAIYVLPNQTAGRDTAPYTLKQTRAEIREQAMTDLRQEILTNIQVMEISRPAFVKSYAEMVHAIIEIVQNAEVGLEIDEFRDTSSD